MRPSLRLARTITTIVTMLLLPVLAAGCGSDASDARPGRDATLLLDFTPNGVHAGIYSAIARGYDDAEGVHLKVRTPGSSTDAVKLLSTGKVDFAVMDIHDLALAREKGSDVVGVMSIAQRPLAAVLAQPGTKSPRDLEGKRVGVTGLPSDDAVLDSVVKGAGGDPDAVRKTTIGFNAIASMISGKVAGATAFWDVEGLALKAKEPGTVEFRVDEFGAPAYPELVLVVNRTTLQDSPDLVRATVTALRRGYGFTLNDADSSASDVVSEVPDADRTQVLDEINVLTEVFLGPTNTPGGLDRSVLEQWSKWEAQFGITRKPPVVADTFAFTYANAKMPSDTTF
jgi:ABC-type nitrate/sulfonate/bicarbonate transport system substrate-binding protein